MNGKLKDWSFSRTGESVLTITTRESCKKLWDALGDQEITFSIKRRVIPRSLNANNYAWSLIEKLAVAVKSDKDSVYEEMLRRYGTGETYTDEAGNECKVLFSLREGVPPALVARHCAETGVGYVEGKKFIHYRAIKGTSEYSTKEMSVFLDGIISECQEVGIETDTPEQIARYKEAWHPGGKFIVTTAVERLSMSTARSSTARATAKSISAGTAWHTSVCIRGRTSPSAASPMRNCGIGKRLHTPHLTLCGSMAAFAVIATRPMRGLPRRWACLWRRPTSECLMSASAARLSKSLRKKRKETVMEDTKKTPAELVADLMLDPGFVLVPQDRYEELIRAETERDVLEATIKGENSYNVERVLDAIQQARSALYRMKMLVLRNADEPEDTADAE